MINRGRVARGAAELSTEGTLQRVADQAAAQYFSEASPSEDALLSQANAQLERLALAYERVGGVVAVVSRLNDAATLEPALDGKAKLVGIGVAQGSRADKGPRVIVAVIMLAWPR